MNNLFEFYRPYTVSIIIAFVGVVVPVVYWYVMRNLLRRYGDVSQAVEKVDLLLAAQVATLKQKGPSRKG